MDMILLITLIFLCCISFLVFHDILSPSFIYTFFFAFSLLIYVLSDIEGPEFSYKTFFIVFFANFILFLGSLVAVVIYKSLVKKKASSSTVIYGVVSNKFITLSIIYLLFVLFLYFQYIRNSLGMYGMTFDLGDYRLLSTSGEKENSFVVQLLVKSTISFGYFYLYQFISYLLINGKVRWRLLFPVLIYVLISILSSGRMDIIYTIISGLIMLIIINNKTRTFNYWKINKLIIKGLISLFIVFYFLGFLTGKNEFQGNIFNVLVLYVGSSIPALNQFLDTFTYSFSNFGSETLLGVKNLLELLGFHPESSSRFLPFILVGNMSSRTNIYTNLRRLLVDYNIFGMLFIQFFMGYFFTFYYEKIKCRTVSGYGIVVFVIFYKYFVMSFTDERVIVNIFSVTTIFMLLVLLVLFKIVPQKVEVI